MRRDLESRSENELVECVELLSSIKRRIHRKDKTSVALEVLNREIKRHRKALKFVRHANFNRFRNTTLV